MRRPWSTLSANIHSGGARLGALGFMAVAYSTSKFGLRGFFLGQDWQRHLRHCISPTLTVNDLFSRFIPKSVYPSSPILCEGLSAPFLGTFRLEKLKHLKLLPKGMHILLPFLIELEIIDCPQVEMFSDGGFSSNIRRVGISSLKLMASLKGALATNTSLEILSIWDVDVESFLVEGLCQLSYLKELHISCGENIQCLPEEGFPNSISTLQIGCSEMLTKRCKKPGGLNMDCEWGLGLVLQSNFCVHAL
ncbi:hypothetical protein Fmac_015683 [Flemingia macrophylla]|uniref:Disease resistance protein n=1 Tax=Flemingia macrophylla TaxID=520843 RepID=A0ABD1MF81_9FABA